MLRLLVVLGVTSTPAWAEHHHMGGDEAAPSTDAPRSAVSAEVSLVAAHFENMLYAGDYQGVTPGVTWAGGRVSAAANLGLYRLQENGRELFGVGDVMVHGQVRVLGKAAVTAGASAMVMLPTGAHEDGLGMGHVMAVPGVWARWLDGRWSLDGSLGFAQALAAAESHHHGGMMWPLVEPMNEQEVTWAAGGDFTLARGLRTGARVSGGVPTGDGVTRVIGGLHVLWTEGRVDTMFEVQAGLAGDPFTLRGVLETALRF
jgi:hypothetical protein